jgi:hypothetical protein
MKRRSFLKFASWRVPLEKPTRMGLALSRKFSEWTHRKIVIGTTYACFLAVLAAPQSEPGLTRSG